MAPPSKGLFAVRNLDRLSVRNLTASRDRLLAPLQAPEDLYAVLALRARLYIRRSSPAGFDNKHEFPAVPGSNRPLGRDHAPGARRGCALPEERGARRHIRIDVVLEVEDLHLDLDDPLRPVGRRDDLSHFSPVFAILKGVDRDFDFLALPHLADVGLV